MPGFKGVIKQGTVARQHHKWTAWVGNKPLIVFHEIYTMDTFDAIEPQEDWPQPWTAMGPANAIPAVVDAPPGFMATANSG
jgi:hypothetical protein